MDTRDVYISGPLFSPAERDYLEAIEQLCTELGLTTYLPHRDAGFGPATGDAAREFFEQDLAMLKHSSGVVAVLNGPDVDSGTAWEVGFAFAGQKRLIGIREDIRLTEVNPMLTRSIRIVDSLSKLRTELMMWSHPQADRD